MHCARFFFFEKKENFINQNPPNQTPSLNGRVSTKENQGQQKDTHFPTKGISPALEQNLDYKHTSQHRERGYHLTWNKI